MTFFLKRKISFFLSGIAQTFLFLPILLNRSVIHVVFLTVVLGHHMPWDSVIRCNNTGTTHSALSSRTELLLPIGGVINFRGRKKKGFFFFAFQFLGMWHYISIILFGCAWKVQIKVFFFCFLGKKMSPKEFRPLFSYRSGSFLSLVLLWG